MTSFTEDKIWKNIGNNDVRILLNIVDVESEEVKIWTQELRIFDPRNYVPDLILELDNENLIMEMQSTPVDDNFSKRGLAYVAVGNKEKKNNKMMNLIVLSTAEESKTVRYNFTENSTFEYRVINLKDLDADEIITTVEEKIRKGLKIESEELIKYALVPMIKGDEMEKYITRVVDNILQVENISESLMTLSYGIEWLIVDKFITDEEYRNILCDKLGDRRSLIYEYGNRREQKCEKKE